MARPRMHAGEVVRIGLTCPEELASLARDLVDGIYYTSLNQVICLALKKFVEEKSSSPLSPTPPIPSSSITPPIISPKGDIYTPPKGPPAKKKTKPGAPEKYSKDFEAFWDIYPRKISKRNAWKAYFSAIKLAKPEEILQGLEASIVGRDWASAEMKFIPHASTWINGRSWEDTFEEQPKHKGKAKKKQAPIDYRPHLKGESCDYWAAAKQDLTDMVGAYDFQSWFEPVRAILVKDTLVIGCPDQAHADWLMQSYRDELLSVIDVSFRVVDAEEFSNYLGVS